jgi:hypothetical protein
VVGGWCGTKYGLASLFGNECQLVINDFDIAFFDALGDRSQELTINA